MLSYSKILSTTQLFTSNDIKNEPKPSKNENDG